MLINGFSGHLWPIRYKPLEDELLSSWIVRLAHGHGMKAQTFCNNIFGSSQQVWNRDIDRLAPNWVLDELAKRTGTAPSAVFATTLRSYEGSIYELNRASGTLFWIQTLQIYHRKRDGYGIQYCPQCLKEGPVPYFRKKWRISFCTICPKHDCMLLDRCPHCDTGIAFHRVDTGILNWEAESSIDNCHACGLGLSQTPLRKISTYSEDIYRWISNLNLQIFKASSADEDFSLSKTAIKDLLVSRKLAQLLISKTKTLNLYEHVCDELNVQSFLTTKNRVVIESRHIDERHHMVQLIAWLMLDLKSKLDTAWRRKAVRYSHLKKDFENAPDHYLKIVENFSNWRLQ